jgi:hypothetical protein
MKAEPTEPALDGKQIAKTNAAIGKNYPAIFSFDKETKTGVVLSD